MKFSQVALALSAVGSVAGARLEKRASKPSATIGQGVVIGTTTTYSGAASAATKFVGIPFAKSPPVRFAPPQKAPSFTGPYDATQTKNACVQEFTYPKDQQDRTKAIFNNPGGAPPVESEDCLYLNVYVPSNTKPDSKKAVLFWIYGGNLQFGAGTLDSYDGSSFASNQDVIVVTHNYRTNVFGYSNAPEIPSARQNVGFLDQRQALQWVQTNIAAFGGDPSRVTIFGESAGGYSVKQLLALPPSPMPYSSAILQSQGATLGNGTASWVTLSTLLGCDTAASQVACLRTKDATEIKSTIEENALTFPPQLNNLTAVPDIRPYLNSGEFAQVPILLGTNADEGRAFTYIGGIDDPTGSSATAITKLTFQCPAAQIASLATQNGYDVWRYYYNASFPNEQLFPNAGAYHSSEIPQVFGTYPRSNVLGDATKNEIKLSAFMQTAWATFAKDACAGPGWAKYGKKNKTETLGFPNRVGGKIVPASQLDTDCAEIFDPIINAGGL